MQRVTRHIVDQGGPIVRYLDGQSVPAHLVLDVLPYGVALVDDECIIADANERLAVMTGQTVEQLIGTSFKLLVPNVNSLTEGPDDPTSPAWRSQWLTMTTPAGSQSTVEVTVSPLRLGDALWYLATARDVHEHAVVPSVFPAVFEDGDADAALAQSEQRFRLAFESNMAPMVFSDETGVFLAVNDAYCRMTGRTRDELLNHDSKHFTYPADVGITEDVYQRMIAGEMDEVRYGKRFLHKSGRIVSTEVSMCTARDDSGHALYFISSVRDVTEERALAAQLSHQALHDPLTGLANRALFDDRLAQAHSRISRQGGFGAVLLLDLDDFKVVNDAYGHLVGDELLVSIARRFEKVTRSTDTLCRFGGDEFLYLAENLATPEEAQIVAQRLLDTMCEPFIIQDLRLEQRASVGVVVWDGSTDDNAELVQNADAAMYDAKRQGTGHIVLFTPEIRNEAVSRFALAQELREALTTDQLMMHYQPIIDLATSRVVGFEALMRWNHPTRGWIPPDVFIPLAENSGLILDLSAFAISEAVSAAVSWGEDETTDVAPYVTVNLSAAQFHDAELIPTIERELERTGLAPERLVLEVTETVALVDITETMNVMESLNRLNIGVALGDFGTGYSSLSYLAALHPRIVKIDQSFVRPRHDKERSATLLEAIITLGNKLDMTVLAEGIETSAQLDRLHNLECDLGQGFLWSPAVPLAQVGHLLDPDVTD